MLIALLIAGTAGVYLQVARHSFIDYDDDLYVVENSHVTSGLSWQTARWAFTATEQSNWHPITWISHALDCQLFGLDGGKHHLVSVVIHITNVLLLFLLLWKATGGLGRSFVVAGLFALHPLNVQSVAWVAERKNVLCTLFVFLTIAAYGRYVRRPRIESMAAVVACFALALASKPMAVTLPFALLLLDWWPLHRIPDPASRGSVSTGDSRTRLLTEKWLLFTLSAASCVITVKAQQLGGAVQSLERFPFDARVGNALWSYVAYIGKLFVPTDLAVLYPHPGTGLAMWKPVFAAVFLVAITITVWRQRMERPYLIVGWLWYLGTMFPVIGIVQVGDQAMADRYAYIPLIGLFGMISWGVGDLVDEWRATTASRWALAAVPLALMAFLSARQLTYWKDSGAIWAHSLEVTGDPAIERQLANALIKLSRFEEAVPHLFNAAKVDPEDAQTHANLGSYYSMHGRREEAIQEFETTVTLTTHSDLNAQDRLSRMSALLGLGFASAEIGNFSDALTSFARAIQLDAAQVDGLVTSLEQMVATQPSEPRYVQLVLLLHAMGKGRESTSVMDEVVKSNPDFARARQLQDFLNGEAARQTKTSTGGEG